MPLVDKQGRTVSLASFHGRVVVLAPTLTLCSEVCPITSGAFIRMEAAVRKAGLGSRVAFVEVTVDPERDTPSRLRAYERLTGVDWTLLTVGAAASVPGALLGARLTGRLDEGQLLRAVGAVLVVAGTATLLQAFI